MPVLQFNFPPETQAETRRLVPQTGDGEGIVLQSQAYGSPVSGIVAPSESVGAGIEPAQRWNSSAPYVDPVVQARKGRCTANDNTCKGFATKRWPGLCAAHGQRQEG